MALSEEQFCQLLGRLAPKSKPTIRIKQFSGDGSIDIRTWLSDVSAYCKQAKIDSDEEKARIITSYLTGAARDEIHSQLGDDPTDFTKVKDVLSRIFGPRESLASVQQSFYSRIQMEHETLVQYSRELLVMYDRIVNAATGPHKTSLKGVQDQALMEQFVAGVRDRFIQQDLERLALAYQGEPFLDFRDEVIQLYKRSDNCTMAKARIREITSENSPPMAATQCQEEIKLLSQAVSRMAQQIGHLTLSYGDEDGMRVFPSHFDLGEEGMM